MKKPRRTGLFLSRKRLHKAILRREHAHRPRAVNDRFSDTFWRDGSHLADLLTCATTNPQAPVSTVRVPKVFSFIREPEKALQTIGALVSAGSSRFVEQVHVDHSELEHYELAAEAVLDVIALDVHRKRIRTGNRMGLSGRFPNDADAQRFVRAIGISRYLNIPGTALPTSEGSKLVVFEQTQRTPDPNRRVKISSEKANVVLEFANHIAKCLSTVGMQLSVEDRQNLCKYTGELIDNVEQHGRSRDWYLSSFLDTSLVPPVCEVAIYNFGRTFAESFLSLPRDNYAWKLVAPYVALHDQFRLFGPSWRIADLLTVVALQGGISSKRMDEDDIRGQGTVDLIEFFEAVSDSCSQSHGAKPEMAIVSGDTHIRFDGKYRMGSGPGGRRVIAFNGSNSLAELPDSAYVRPLKKVIFPGTLVSIRFSLGKPNTAMDVSNE